MTRAEFTDIPLNNTRVGEGNELWDLYTSNWWQISVMRIAIQTVSSTDLTTILEDSQIAIVTTSYPYIGLPRSTFRRAQDAIGLYNEATWLDCSARSKLPALVFEFGGAQTLRLGPRDYLLEVWDDMYESAKCVSTFVSLAEHGDDGARLLGSPFLTGLHTVFDAGRKSIAFANRS